MFKKQRKETKIVEVFKEQSLNITHTINLRSTMWNVFPHVSFIYVLACLKCLAFDFTAPLDAPYPKVLLLMKVMIKLLYL